jgi:hypothetical protein
MNLSRRDLMSEASIMGLLAAMAPELKAAQAEASKTSGDDAPHDSFNFWNGFFDGMDPAKGQVAVSRGPADQLPDPAVQTQYLQYQTDKKTLRYATEIGKDELLDHPGDVAVGIKLSQYRPAAGTAGPNNSAAQLRMDTTQLTPFKNLMSPLAWSSIASIVTDKSGFVSLDRLGLKTTTATQGMNKILLTNGTGRMAVNISRAPQESKFVKVLNVIMQGLKTAAPLVTLPAISIPALTAFTQAMSYWEDRTKFIMAGNLMPAVATQPALADPSRGNPYLGLVSGDYLMVAQQHADELAKELPNLDLVQGYLVRKDADQNIPLEKRAAAAIPDVTYFSMRVSVSPVGSDDSAAATKTS